LALVCWDRLGSQKRVCPFCGLAGRSGPHDLGIMPNSIMEDLALCLGSWWDSSRVSVQAEKTYRILSAAEYQQKHTPHSQENNTSTVTSLSNKTQSRKILRKSKYFFRSAAKF